MNIALRQLQEGIVSLVNSAQLPTEAKRLVVSEILRKLEVQAEMEIAFEIQERSKQTEAKEE